jgi:hypothetical protein
MFIQLNSNKFINTDFVKQIYIANDGTGKYMIMFEVDGQHLEHADRFEKMSDATNFVVFRLFKFVNKNLV